MMNLPSLNNKVMQYKYKITYDNLYIGYKYDAGFMSVDPPFFNPKTQKICFPEEELENQKALDAIQGKIYFPDQNNFDLGRNLVFRFIEEYAPEKEDEVHDIFQSSGAYRRFRSFVQNNELLEKWYKYESYHEALVLINWANERDLEVVGLERF